MDCDRIVVRGMATTYTVQSFRLTKPSKFLLHKLVEIKKKKKDEIAELLRMKEFMERRFQREGRDILFR